MIFSSILQENMKKNLEESTIDNLFESHFPTIIYKDFSHRAGLIYQVLSDNIKNTVTADLTIFSNRAIFSCLLFIYLLFLAYSKFLIGGLFVILVAVSAYLNQLSWGQAFNTLLTQQSHAENHLITWVHDYFKSYKEISKTWPAPIHDRSWLTAIYRAYANQKKKVNAYIFKRTILAQLLIEMPYLITSTAVFFGIYYNKLSLPFAFAWLGLSQFMITAAKGLSKNGELKKTRQDSLEKLNTLLHDIKKPAPMIDKAAITDRHHCYRIPLQNGDHVTFTLTPGLYPIRGSNGAGKSTLLDTIAGFDRLATLHKNSSIRLLKKTLANDQIRIIDPQACIIDCLGSFENQLNGPFAMNVQTRIFSTLYHQLLLILSPSLATQWRDCLFRLSTTFNARTQKELSSGEKILLSFGRLWLSWQDSIKLLIIDECDSALDAHNKKLFFDTLHELQQKLTILMVSHHH